MAFRVRNKRNGCGTYTLSYGRGKSTLSAEMARCEEGWCTIGGDGDGGDMGPFRSMKECKQAWGAWAEAHYEGGGASPPTPPKPPGPPTLTPRMPDSVDYQYAADPFDPRYRYPSDHDPKHLAKHLTPIGVLVEIDSWIRRHESAIDALSPSPFDPMIESVRQCLRRELEIKEPDDGTADDPTD